MILSLHLAIFIDIELMIVIATSMSLFEFFSCAAKVECCLLLVPVIFVNSDDTELDIR